MERVARLVEVSAAVNAGLTAGRRLSQGRRRRRDNRRYRDLLQLLAAGANDGDNRDLDAHFRQS